MPAFRYEAADAAGKTDKGVIEADSARQARTVLRARGLTPLVVDALGAQATKRGGSSFGKRLSAQENALVTRQLASLLVAGLPLDEALAALADQAERAYVGELLAAIRAEVVGGSSLSVALAQHPKDFPDIYRALVSAGEHSGNLGLVLSRCPPSASNACFPPSSASIPISKPSVPNTCTSSPPTHRCRPMNRPVCRRC